MENREQRIFLFIASFVIFYVGFVGSLCYEMGKNGIYNIDWSFVLQMNVPIFIVAVTLFYRAFHQKISKHENN